LSESDASIVMLDRYPKPGGHWNFAYPFVTLHQPSEFYGVSSKELSNGRRERGGFNDGLHEMATGGEVSAYFEEVMRNTFLPSGRVQYFPMCDYQGDGRFSSILGNDTYEVEVANKVVDCTLMTTKVPSTHTPNFGIDEGVHFIPLNDLPKLKTSPERIMVVGGGKTAIDACIWLLRMGVDPDSIDWVRPRDAWLLNRKNTQPSADFFFDAFGNELALLECAAAAENYPDLFDRLEGAGYFLRIDKDVRPEMFHGATVSELELAWLQKIKNVIRLGRITHLGADEITFEKGKIDTRPNTVYVDCSATPIDELPKDLPVFNGKVITPQMVRAYQPVFSAALIAHLEVALDTDEEKNTMSTPVPPPLDDTDFALMTATAMMNQYQWSLNEELSAWLLGNRLDCFGKLAEDSMEDPEKADLLSRMGDVAEDAVTSLYEIHNQYHAQNSDTDAAVTA
ncbi:MAG: NAD(P)/FAD-dependent oxidoreductase, partial [Pseudomonadota bacterium]